MNPILIFILVLVAIALGGWIVSKITGSHAWFVETWVYNEGEVIIWRDPAADVVIVTLMGRAVVMRPIRVHRWSVVVTNQRILVGNKTFTGKQMVRYVLWPGRAPDDRTKRADGGLFTVGYTTLAIEPSAMTVHGEGNGQYVALKPIAAEASSINLSEIRFYTTEAASFRLP